MIKFPPAGNRHTSIIAVSFSALIFFLSNCTGHGKDHIDPVAKVIHSISDTPPHIVLPEGVDTNDINWKGIDLSPKAPVLPLYPEDEAKQIILPPGYHLEPVLTEPQIEQPAAIAFDGDGRMYVLELRSYMLDADSDSSLAPISRISRWEDKDNDGVYETGTVFVDHLIFPRFVLPYGKDCILTMESDADNVYKYTDTDGDGKADKKEFFTNHYGRAGNVEHQQAFMYYGMDNWLYSTVNAFRVRETANGVIREKTGFNRAQWGIAQDDDGKLWFQGGASGLPSYFQFPIHYGNFDFKEQFADGFDIPWGEPLGLADVQGGMDQVRLPEGSLNRVTGAAGNDVFRGDRLPKKLEGQYFYGEAVARIVRQVNPVVSEGLTTLHNIYQDKKSEFLRSKDPLFRPVDMATAPDGTMYIVDMYHGIIQEGQWTQKGSYLRAKIDQYQMAKVIGLGRIWRLTYDGMNRDKIKPQMFEETSGQLIKHLQHPNGWWRDEAQKLIVLKKDKSVVPALEKMVSKDPNVLARIHALWCLEGLGSLSSQLAKEQLSDPNPRMRIQALRCSETLYKMGNKSFSGDYLKLLKDANTDVAIQAMLTAQLLQIPSLNENIRSILTANKMKGIQFLGNQILNTPSMTFETSSGPKLTDTQKEILTKGAVIFNELCSQCHGADGMGTPAGNGYTIAPPFAASSRVQGHADYLANVLLHGLEGPIEGKTYQGAVMVPMSDQTDEWIASVLSYIRFNFGNESSLVTKEDITKVRKQTAGRKTSYKYPELTALVPQLLVPAEDWKVTASHNAPARIGGKSSPSSVFNYEGWTTGERQQPGMWFQIEFPKPILPAEIQFVSPSIKKDSLPVVQTYPRAFEILVSMDGGNWKLVTKGTCDTSNVVVSINPTPAKFLKIIQTGRLPGGETAPWSMRQLRVYAFLKK